MRTVQPLQSLRRRLRAVRRLQPVRGGRCDQFGLRGAAPRCRRQPLRAMCSVRPLRSMQSLRECLQPLRTMRSL